MSALMPVQSSPPPPVAPSRSAVHAWGWSLLTLFLALLAGAMILLIARRLAFSGKGAAGRAAKKRPTDTRSAWEEAGRRMQTPDTDLKEEP